MNKTYRIVWCAKTATFIAAAETARAKGKSARSGARALSCAVLLTLGGVAGAAHAGALDGGSTASGLATDIAYGNGAKTTNAAGGKAAVAIGQNASANNLSGATPNADGTVAVGDSANATDGGVAVGGASYAGSMATAVGAGATAATANSVALGSNSVANSTTLGTAGFAPVGGTAISAATAAGEVSIGKAGAERRITNVAAGLNPTDAVNVSQLMSEDAKVNNISDKVTNIVNGGGIKYFHVNSTRSDSQALGQDSVAAGPNAVSSGANEVAIGLNASTSGGNSVAIGQGTSAGAFGVALGMNSNASGLNAVALGRQSTAAAVGSIAIGSAASVSDTASTYAVAIGRTATVTSTGTNSVALGQGSTADRANTLSVGASGAERQIVNVANGVQNTDAVNVRQLKGVTTALGGGAAIDATTGAVTGPTYVVGGSTFNNVGGAISNIDARTTQNASDISNIDARTTQNSNDISNLTTAINSGDVGLVQQDATTRNITVAKAADGTIVDFTGAAGARMLTGLLAGDVSASSADAVNGSQLFNVASSTASAIGGGSTVNRDGSISLPSYVIGGMTMSSIGGAITNIDARTTQNASDISSINAALSNITIGGAASNKYFHTNSVLTDSQATGSDAVAIGGAAVATAANSVALGSNSVADRAGSVSVGSTGAERQITNVAAGTADTDAVNVAQMNSALANVTNIAMNAASGSPTFATNGDGGAQAAKATGHHATAMGSNAQASADNSVALGADSVADRENTVSIGSKGKERQITNVAAGTQGTDAVNVDQLNETVAGAVGNLPAGMSAKDYTDQRFNSMQNTVNQVAKNSYAGVAAAMAMPNMTPSQPGNTVVAAGAGSYKSGAALGVGATYRSRNSKWLVNGAVSVTSTGDAGVRAQVGYEF
ncbi:ESPR-type extended signal peptide-containing protein [Paraburkholderia caribensis]|uniref:ESPR-type extended signal peptide-containing protein n=1 Tax=Paraburkholderia caribensis TaxID=75105 RepID=A0ABV0DYM0_9BURK